jgi:hypothetical protein
VFGFSGSNWGGLGPGERRVIEDLLYLLLMPLLVKGNHPERLEHVLATGRGMLAKHPKVVEVRISLEEFFTRLYRTS